MNPRAFFLACSGVVLAAASCGTTVDVTPTSSATEPTGTGATGVVSGSSTGVAGGPSTGVSPPPSACSGTWSETFATTGNARLFQVAAGPGGDVFVLGWVEGTVNLGQGPLTSLGGSGKPPGTFIARLDCTGKPLWSKIFETAATSYYGLQMAVDPTGDLLLTGPAGGPLDLGCGPLTDGVLLAKLDGSGACLWSKTFGEPDDGSASVIPGDSGGMVVSGPLTGSVDFGGGPLTAPPGLPGAFVVALDAGGSYVWGKAIAATPPSLARDASGGVLLCGQGMPGLDLGGGSLGDGLTLFFARLDPAGGLVWSSAYPSDDSWLCSLAPDASGGFVVVGTYPTAGLDLGSGPLPAVGPPGSGSRGGYIASFGADGALRFALGSGGTSCNTVPASAAVDAAGDILVAGSFGQPVTFGGETLTGTGGGEEGNVFALKLTPSGTLLWSRRFGGSMLTDLAYGAGLAISGSGAPIVVGDFSGTLDFGDGAPLHGTGDPNSEEPSPFIAQLAP